ncbi:MAG: bifunctional alpha,alpha-trehalose-phosphate synthase (UDP-forming)/trehalose-phosphatase [Candidatus Micrarchaeota archaeon]|nr:bifunctional alpha,alpha-trehalose-phosphate synthase (UDP-forming)/trehalose-phosphatase [Candidatus Micrarchaeota archaeon]
MRYIIVSNRLPLSFTKGPDGKIAVSEAAGGLASGIKSYLKAAKIDDYLWVGWPGGVFDDDSDRKDIRRMAGKSKCSPVFLAEKDYEGFYNGFCNSTLQPLFHYFTEYANYDDDEWEAYRKVNERFCEEVAGIVQPGDIVWIHDYHLMLLPAMLKGRRPQARIGFFLHIPFPSYEVFRLLPGGWGRALLSRLLGADLIGFHTYDYMQDFVTSVSRLLGYDSNLGYIEGPDSELKRVDAFPMGIDFGNLQALSRSDSVAKEKDKLKKSIGDAKIIFSIDRLDYTKGILNRLNGYDLFLERHPQMRGRVRLVLVVVPSREGVREYKKLKMAIDEKVGRINGRFGAIDWAPITYQYRFLDSSTLSALFNMADVALVTPLRDGMNLIAKEYVASKLESPGVLVLSEMAGASKELGEAVMVNPNHPGEICNALETALTMPIEEQMRRMIAMQERVRSYDIVRWGNDFMKELAKLKEMQEVFNAKLLGGNEAALLSDHGKAGKALLLLDYDGTMVPFTEEPRKASPTKQTLDMLRSLCSDPKNEVVVTSGRDKATLDKWFSGIGVSLVAEHGVFIKERGADWRLIRPLTAEWKPMIMPIINDYAGRLPGSFVEEKEFSIVWHYRKSESEFASLRVSELFDNLSKITANADVQVCKGNKIIEVKNSGVNKGVAAAHFINLHSPDFILAIGDDYTDEDTFKSLPKSAYSIRVGMAQSYARFNLHGTKDVQQLLSRLAEMSTVK